MKDPTRSPSNNHATIASSVAKRIVVEPISTEEMIRQAHDRLHKGDIEAAHQFLHKALGMPDETPEPVKGLSRYGGFEQAFVTASRKHRVLAAWVVFEPDPARPGMARLLAGGNADACAALKSILGKGAKI